MGGLGCCCCVCQQLKDYLDQGKISIPGYSQVGSWIHLSGESYDTDLCCSVGYFAADDCEIDRVCDSCGPHFNEFGAAIIDQCEGVPVGDGKWHYCARQLDLASGCVIEVRIYRHWYDASEACGDLRWCKVVVFAGWRDYTVFRQVQQDALPDFVDDLIDLETCELLLCGADDCESANQDPCLGATWNCITRTYLVTWWRVRLFDTIPTGSVCFGEEDITLGECNDRVKCVDPGDLPFDSLQICFPDDFTEPANPNVVFNIICNSVLWLPPCGGASDPALNCGSLENPWGVSPGCVDPPDSFCLEFAAP